MIDTFPFDRLTTSWYLSGVEQVGSSKEIYWQRFKMKDRRGVLSWLSFRLHMRNLPYESGGLLRSLDAKSAVMVPEHCQNEEPVLCLLVCRYRLLLHGSYNIFANILGFLPSYAAVLAANISRKRLVLNVA